jgi:hypothetical protein
MGKEDDMSGLVAERCLTGALSTSGARNTAADIKKFAAGTASSRQTRPTLFESEPFRLPIFHRITLHFVGLR